MSNLLRKSYSYIRETCPSVDSALGSAQHEIQNMVEESINLDGVFTQLEKSIKNVTEEFRSVLVGVLEDLENLEGEKDDLTTQVDLYQQQIEDLQRGATS